MARRTLSTYEHVDVPYDDVILLLAEDAAGVVQAATESAVSHAEDVVGRLTVEVAGFEVGRDVTIEVGEFHPVALMQVEVPLRWRAQDNEALFPSMDASLEVRMVPVDTRRTQLVLTGAYRVPLGPVGAAIDVVAGHHVAEAAVHRFVRDIAGRLEQIEQGLLPSRE